jgi:hypothetical protein
MATVLRRVLECTEINFRLIVVDCGMPSVYRREIDEVLARFEDVEVIHEDGWLLPNECRRLVAAASRTELTCFLENDVLVSPGWLTALVGALDATGAGVAAPLVMEGEESQHHGVANGARFEFMARADGTELVCRAIGDGSVRDGLVGPQLVEVVEAHCMLFRTEVFSTVDAFDPFLNTREFIDTCLALRKAGIGVVLQPQSRVTFMPPPPVLPDERPYYLYKWNQSLAEGSHQRIREKWGLVDFPSSLEFAAERRHRLSRGLLWRYRLTRQVLRVPRRARRLGTEIRQLAGLGGQAGGAS